VTFRPRFALLLLSAFFCTFTLAQTHDQKPGSVSGKVIWEGIGAGIRKVVIILHAGGTEGQPIEVTTATDAEGRFRFESVPAGTYDVTLMRAGFIATGKNVAASQVIVSAGHETSGLLYKMEATGVIAGKITEADGDPLPGVSVWVTRVGKKGTEFSATPDSGDSGQETTNDLGEFRIANLRAGQYLVQAQAHGISPAPDPAEKGRQRDPATYTLTFFPGTLDVKGASPVQVTPGGTSTANFGVLTSRSYHVSGTVTLTGSAQNMQMYLVSTSGQTEAHELGDGGKFDFGGVQPGTYVAQIVDMGPSGPRTQIIGSPIVVSNTDVSSLVLQPEANGSVSGKVRTDEGETFNWKQLTLNLVRVPQDDDLPQLSNIGALGASTGLQEDGSFEMKDVAGSSYLLFLGAKPVQYQDYYLKSVTVDGRDVMDYGFPVNGPTNVEIVVSSKGASIDGTVVNAEGQNMANAAVLVIPTAGKEKRLDLYNAEKSDSNGHFLVRGLTPGAYILVALDNIPDDSGSLEFFQQYKEKGQTVDLAEGDKKSVVVNMTEEKE
jgi:hypothetical protein